MSLTKTTLMKTRVSLDAPEEQAAPVPPVAAVVLPGGQSRGSVTIGVRHSCIETKLQEEDIKGLFYKELFRNSLLNNDGDRKISEVITSTVLLEVTTWIV